MLNTGSFYHGSITLPLLPLSFYLQNKTIVYIFIILVTAACLFLLNTVLIQVNLIISQSATSDLIGCANGIGTSINSFGSSRGILG